MYTEAQTCPEPCGRSRQPPNTFVPNEPNLVPRHFQSYLCCFVPAVASGFSEFSQKNC